MAVYGINGNLIMSGTIANLSDYGDISTASGFASAFNAAVADTEISGISIPFGSYALNTSLMMRSGFSIHGNGATITMGAGVDTFKFISVHDCLVESLKIDMAQTKSSTSGTALYIVDSSRITCRDMRIINIGVRACLAYPTDQTSAGNLNRLIFERITMQGIGEANANQSEWPCGIIAVNATNSIIRECVVSGMSRFTLEYKNYCSDCSMIDNTVVGGESGLAIGGDRPASETILAERITFIGNRVTGCKYPLYFGRCNNLNVVGNIIEGDSMWVEKCQKCMFTGNIIVGSRSSQNALLDIRTGNYIIFQNNRYEKASGVNLYRVDSSTDINVSGYYNGDWFSVHDPTSGTPSA